MTGSMSAYMARYNDKRHFGGNRTKALATTNGRCQSCKEEAGLVHHVDGDKDNHNISNLSPLCRSCHARIHTQERMDALSPAVKKQMIDHARSFITTAVARRRAHTQHNNRLALRGESAVLRRHCQWCGTIFERCNIARYRRGSHCSLTCARKTSWQTRRGA